MSEIINIGAYSPLSQTERAYRTTSPSSSARPSEPVRDSVELSDFGRALADATESSTFRLARVRAVRTEIEQGVYETPERLASTVNRMLDVLA